MNCIICNSNKKPWLILNNKNISIDEDGKMIGSTVHTCSYLCSKKLRPQLPPNYGNLIANKDDFSYLMPHLNQKKKEFQFLTLDEIMKLTDDEKEEYYRQKDEAVSIDSAKGEIYDEIESEDWKTYQIENDLESGSDTDYDDY